MLRNAGAAALLAALTLAGCHMPFPGVVCPPPEIVTRTRIVHAPDARIVHPARKPLTPAERQKAERSATQLQHEAERLDAKIRAILKKDRK